MEDRTKCAYPLAVAVAANFTTQKDAIRKFHCTHSSNTAFKCEGTANLAIAEPSCPHASHSNSMSCNIGSS